ncbi:MAG: hypothetical protein HYU59_15045 [Magnetospirillum gryphiswaldense]|nr:hypothetical protein [Magnetospirillum gryphiswaldense]
MSRRLRLTRPSGKPERLAAAFLLGLALFLPPLLNVASRDELIGGVPILVLWLFGGWLVLIVILALVVESSPHDDETTP